MRVADGVAHAQEQRQPPAHSQRALVAVVGDPEAIDEFHDQVWQAAGRRATVDQLRDRLVLERREDLSFGPEALRQIAVAHGANEFDRHACAKVVVPLGAQGWAQQAALTDFLPGIVYNPTSALPKGTHVILSAAVLDMAMAQKHLAEVLVVLGDTVLWDPCDPDPMTCGTPGGMPCCIKG